MQVFIAGSHTDVGKTSVSAALCYAFGFEYFKLVQAGIPTDNEKIHALAPKTKIHASGITLQTPASPHIAMQLEQKSYQGLEIPLPSSKALLIESAGGLFSPLDAEVCMIDYLRDSKLPCILVGGYYLGGINHILLSIHALKSYGIPLLGVIVSNVLDERMDAFIQNYSCVKIAHFKPFSDLRSFEVNALSLREEILSLKILSAT